MSIEKLRCGALARETSVLQENSVAEVSNATDQSFRVAAEDGE
jgi:hypothetical protein